VTSLLKKASNKSLIISKIWSRAPSSTTSTKSSYQNLSNVRHCWIKKICKIKLGAKSSAISEKKLKNLTWICGSFWKYGYNAWLKQKCFFDNFFILIIFFNQRIIEVMKRINKILRKYFLFIMIRIKLSQKLAISNFI
jgi:hypothetical protein